MRSTTPTQKLGALLAAIAFAAGCASPPAGDSDSASAKRNFEAQVAALSYGELADGTVPFAVGMDLGTGMDAVSKTVLSQANCLDFAGRAAEIEMQSNFAELSRYQVLRDKSELREVLDISGKIGGTFGVVRVEVEASYYDEIVRDSNSVYVLVQSEIMTSSYSIKSPTMTLDGYDGEADGVDNRDGSVPGTIRHYFGSDYDRFRKKCGDRYLQGVVTGGRYLAVLEIKTTSRYDKNRIEGELKGTYLPFMISIAGGLELFLEELQTNHEVRVHVVSRGDDRTDNVVSLSGLEKPDPILVSELIDDINRFRAAVVEADREASKTPFGYRKGALYAIFDGYQPTANGVLQGGFPTAQVERMEEYSEAFSQYNEVERSATAALLRPEEHFAADDVAVELVATEARLSRRALEQASARCAQATAPICRGVAELGLVPPQELRERLPGRRPLLPRDCSEVRDYFADTNDGEKLVYLGGRADEPFWLWCDNMAGEEPRNYLSLRAFDPASETPGTNYSRVFGGVDEEGEVVSDSLSIYEKLQVHVTDDGLVVVPGQPLFVSDATGATQSAEAQVAWGTSRTCAISERIGAVAELTGTGFGFANDIAYRVLERSVYVETGPMTWFQAYRFADENGAELLHVSDEREQEDARLLLNDYGAAESWLGMMNSRADARSFRWMDGVQTPYRNWAVGHPRARPGEQACAWLDADGTFREGSCRVQRPLILERRRIRFAVDQRPAELRLRVEARANCGTVVPEKELRLRYVGNALEP